MSGRVARLVTRLGLKPNDSPAVGEAAPRPSRPLAVRIDRQVSLPQIPCLAVSLLPEVKHGSVEQRIRVLRVGFEGTSVGLLGLVRAACGFEQVRQVVPAFGEPRLDLGSQTEEQLGLAVPALSAQQVGEVEGGAGIRAIELYAPAIEPFGTRKVPGVLGQLRCFEKVVDRM